jgi:hypothetical protein
MLAQEYEYRDDEGALAEVASACAAGLARCLAVTPAGHAARQAMLRALFDLYAADTDESAVPMGEEVPDLILQHATPEERREVAGWVRGELLDGDEPDEWYGSFLLSLEADELDDETFLQRSRQAGETEQLVERLLRLGRTDEALRELEQAEGFRLLSTANVLVTAGYADEAERVVAQRLGTRDDPVLLAWLKERSKARGDTGAALDRTLRLFSLSPTIDGYREARELATALGRWDSVRTDLRATLEQKQQLALLARVFLDAGELDRALEVVPRLQAAAGGQFSFGHLDPQTGEDMRLVVARAAEETRPQAAIATYRALAEGLIEARGRPNYQRAADLLARVRMLHQRLGEEAYWRAYIEDLRQRTRTLRALAEELTAAGL